MLRRLPPLLFLGVLLACAPGADDDASDESALAVATSASADRPWEIRSAKGESILPNVFYAEASENEQVMPLTIGGRYAIDRMVYPTIGNPSLYTKDDAADAFMVVLRIEEDVLAHLAPKISVVEGSPLGALALREDAANALAFELVSRPARAANTTRPDAVPANAPGVVAVRPSALFIDPVPADLPAAFKQRRTVRAVFSQAAMKNVPAGLYDVRFEVKRGGQVAERKGGGNERVYEYQYNALRVFDRGADEYTALNVTDTQVSVGAIYSAWNTRQLEEFVKHVNASTDPTVKRAAFITFNGDLHNGGSPGGVLQRYVAVDYNEEAKVILEQLKELPLPIFLVPGNHDGSVATGVAPNWVVNADWLMFESLKEVVEEGKPEWPGFRWEDYDRYLKSVAKQPGGRHHDLVSGSFVRRHGARTFAQGWKPVPREQRNMVLYDGFHQWQRTYGPLYSSFSFGKSRYVNVNSFDLRQHKRAGWGMFIVNYGGGLSRVQEEWLNEEIARGAEEGQDLVVLAHHDPRGGHGGQDFGYYFEQLEYMGLGQSVMNYVSSQLSSAVFCRLPTWAITDAMAEDCLHDGLADWMRPDEEYDCEDEDRLPNGTCDVARFDPKLPNAHRPHFSGYAFIDALARSTNVRTMLVGHGHYNSLEMLQTGAALVPDAAGLQQLEERLAPRLAAGEVRNPIRAQSWQSRGAGGPVEEYDPAALSQGGVAAANGRFFAQLEGAASGFHRVVEGDRRELAVVRLTSNAAMTRQKFDGEKSYGYAVLHVKRKNDARGYALPQINDVTFIVNGGDGDFEVKRTVSFDRTASVASTAAGNPVAALFEGGQH